MNNRSMTFAGRDARRLLARAAAAAAVALALAGALAYLYLQSPPADADRQHATLSRLHELKQLDARWDVGVLRARAEFAPSPAVATDAKATLTRIRQELVATASALPSPALEKGFADLDKSLTEKAALVSGFLAANAAVKQTLKRVLDAENEIAGLVRGAWRDYPDRERLVAVENVVILLLAEAQKYYFAPGQALRKNIDTLLDDLGAAAARLPPALVSGLARLTGNVQDLLKAKPGEQTLYERLAYHPAGPRIDSLTHAFSRELGATHAARALNRVYLAACGSALLIALGYLAALPLIGRRRMKSLP